MQLGKFHWMSAARRSAILALIALSTLASVSPAAEQKHHVFFEVRQRGKACLVSFDAQSVTNVTLLSDVRRIHCATSGHFLYENQAKEWFKGHVSAPEKKVAIPVALTPACKSDDIVDARISNNGAKVAWITQGRIRRDRKVFPQSVLIVVDVVTGDTGAVVRIEREGIMAAASWSPDDTRVAFYYGEGKAYEKDGYTLQLCDLTKAGEVKEIAPPSLWLTPGAADAFRSQPAMWSPDGTGLVFQGRYTEKENERFSFVRTDGTGLTAVQGIIKGWSTDSARMLMRSGQKLMTRTPAPSANAEELRALPLPDIDMTALSSDGKYMVLQSFLSPVSRAVDVLEMESGKTRRLFDCEDGTEAWPLVWIESDRP